MRGDGHSNAKGWPVVAVAVAMLAAGLGISHAGTLDLEAHERDGPPVAGLVIRLVPHDSGATGAGWGSRVLATVVTGRDGKASIGGIAPGRYTFRFGGTIDPNLLLPDHNPFVPVPVVTLDEPHQSVRVRFQLWRGVPLSVEVSIAEGDLPHGSVRVMQVETGDRSSLPFDGRADGDRRHFERTLVTGRHELRLDVPPGFLVSSLDVNGESIPGAVARLDTALDARAQYVTWEMSAPSEIRGRLIPEGPNEAPGITVVAHLLEPGPWAVAEAMRGRFHGSVPVFRWELPERLFRIRLPPGRWRVQPEGDGLEASDPPFADIEILAGESRRQDFVVTPRDRDRRAGLVVHVRSPDGRRLEGAFVAVYRADEAPEPNAAIDHGAAAPVATGRTSSQGGLSAVGARVVFRGLDAGTYRIVAGHPEWLDGAASVEIGGDDAGRSSAVVVRLERGAGLAVRAIRDGTAGSPEPNVEVEIVVDASEFPSPLEDPDLRAERRRRVGRTDATGRVDFRGLAPVPYRAEARVSGEYRTTRYARVRVGEDHHATFEWTPEPARVRDLEVVVFEGASISTFVDCDDSGPVPPVVDVVAFAGGNEAVLGATGPGAADVERADFLREGLRLSGRGLDRLTTGPFAPETYRVAIRPHGFRTWTWVPGTVWSAEAGAIALVEARETDLGTVELRCGPTVVLTARLADGGVLPDLRDGHAAVEGVRRRDSGEPVSSHPEIEVRRAHVAVNALEPGRHDLTVSLGHPFLVPSSMRIELRDRRLERGETLGQVTVFEDVGGAVRAASSASAVRVSPVSHPQSRHPDPRTERVASVDAGRAFVGGLRPGLWRVSACADPGCTSAVGAAVTVEVEPLETVEVRLAARRPPSP